MPAIALMLAVGVTTLNLKGFYTAHTDSNVRILGVITLNLKGFYTVPIFTPISHQGVTTLNLKGFYALYPATFSS